MITGRSAISAAWAEEVGDGKHAAGTGGALGLARKLIFKKKGETYEV